ncbi:MAG TPA: hypothetical protein VFQ53_32430 [Kofleriaceae bacterium]|nr:hypothetical protein [Kofleriaceae bacterium]
MTKSILAATAAVSLVACVQQDQPPAGIARAIPTADQVRINLPTGTSRTVGELAEWYVATRNITQTFNGGSAWVLILIHTIVQFPVTSVDGNTYTWGPWSDALDPAEYKLDVVDVGDGTYTYQLSGRSKTVAGSAFEVIIDGTADPRAGDLQGNGEFQIDFDAGRRVNPVDAGDERGQVEVRYDLAQRHLDLTIMSVDDNGNLVTGDYAYDERADGGGAMTFDVDADTGGTSALEQVGVHSQWQANGAGRADLSIKGGDAGAGATATECWNNLFARTFYTDSVGFAPTEGDAASCAF